MTGPPTTRPRGASQTPYPTADWWLRDVPSSDRWTDVNIARFLRLYRARPALWDPRAPGYGDPSTRRSEYNGIAKGLRLRNVDGRRCARLAERLRSRYAKGREFRGDDDAGGRRRRRPAWFGLIDDIVRRILSPLKIDADTVSLEACKACCAEKNLEAAPCCRYREAKGITESLQACRDCCAKQNVAAPCCRHLHPGPDASLNSHDGREDCRDDEARNSPDASPCDRPAARSSRENAPNARDDHRPADAGREAVNLVMLSIAMAPKKPVCDKEDSECDSLNASTPAESGDDDDGDANAAGCGCADGDDDDDDDDDARDCDRSGNSSARSSSASLDSCAQAYQTMVAICNLANQVCGSERASSESRVQPCEDEEDREKGGLFRDSLRFHGKRIHLLGQYKMPDQFDKKGEKGFFKTRPRFFGPRNCSPSDVYPLQLNM